MKNSLLLLDIGNSAVKIALSRMGMFQKIWTIPIESGWSEKSLAEKLQAIFATESIAGRVYACSVVPGLNGPLEKILGEFFHLQVFFAGRDFEIPLGNAYENPGLLGQDRLAAAYGARRIFPDPLSLIVVDCGTAITFDCVSGNTFQGGLIFPGMMLAMRALAENAAQLPLPDLARGDIQAVPCINTGDCLQAGLLLGYADLLAGLCHRLKSRLARPVKILLTGGYAPLLAKNCKFPHNLVSDLVLKGLNFMAFPHNFANWPIWA